MKEDNEQKLAMLLGYVMLEASNLELGLRTTAINLLKSPYAEIIVSGEPVSRLEDICRNVASANDAVTEESSAELAAILRRAREAFTRRNNLVHGAWAVDPSTMERAALVSKRWKEELQETPVTEAALRELRSDFGALNGDLLRWGNREFPQPRSPRA